MKPLPLPIRVAAGLAVTTAERVRELPKQVAGLPVTVVSQVLQFSMRLQQHLTELAIKGDNALASFRPVEDTPSWATFDEDTEPEAPAANNGHRPGGGGESPSGGWKEQAVDPWEQEEHALAEEHPEGEFDSGAVDPEAVVGPAEGVGPRQGAGDNTVLANYDELTLPQLRARLRRYSLEQLEELLAYEQTHANRPSFVGMLTRRIGNVQRMAEGNGG